MTGCGEAETIKLFANTYLALRIGFFNELDTFAELRGLDTGSIIHGICQDPRIGQYYNNPSFGYGGYCLPKDTRQLLASCRETPQTLIGAAVSSNGCRKSFIARQICRRVETLASQENSQPVVGIYRLAMKSGSDNFRCSAIFDVMEQLRQAGVPMLLYEPALTPGQTVDGCRRTDDLAQFKSLSSLIVANRLDDGLSDVQDKVYTGIFSGGTDMKAQNVSLEGKTILVTGGAGFIGARLSQLLLERIHPVRVVVLDELNDYYDPRLKYWRLEQLRHTADRYAAQGSRFAFVRGSIADEHLVRRTFADYAPAVVVNLAAQAGVRYSIDHPDAYIESNLVGFFPDTGGLPPLP